MKLFTCISLLVLPDVNEYYIAVAYSSSTSLLSDVK